MNTIGATGRIAQMLEFLTSFAVRVWGNKFCRAGELIDAAFGYAVFPTIGKGAIGGAHGSGRVYKGNGKLTGETKIT